MAEGLTGVTITRCILTTYPANEKAPGFSPPTAESARRGEAQALPAGHSPVTVRSEAGQ